MSEVMYFEAFCSIIVVEHVAFFVRIPQQNMDLAIYLLSMASKKAIMLIK